MEENNSLLKCHCSLGFHKRDTGKDSLYLPQFQYQQELKKCYGFLNALSCVTWLRITNVGFLNK